MFNFIMMRASSDGAEAIAIGVIQGLIAFIGISIYYSIKKKKKTKFFNPDKYPSDEEDDQTNGSK